MFPSRDPDRWVDADMQRDAWLRWINLWIIVLVCAVLGLTAVAVWVP